MLQVKCIEKIRDKNNHIIGYKLIDKNKNAIVVKSSKLKSLIQSKQLEVINLTLTSDNRLISKKPATQLESITTPTKQNNNVKSIINKAKAIGYTIDTIDTDCGHKCYMANSQDNLNHILIVPDDVKYIYNPNMDTDSMDTGGLDESLLKIEGALKIIGGRGLTSTHCMFARCRAKSIDLRSFDTSKVTDMSYMFCECEAQSLDLRSFDTSKVTDMSYMFYKYRAQSLDLRSFNTSKVETMGSMFDGCIAQIKVNDPKIKDESTRR